jgi:peptidoglycan/LPS O-acetylase OafA/YrhL
MPQMVENLPGYIDCFAAGMLSAFTYVRLHDRAKPNVALPATLAAVAGIALFWLLSENLYDARLVDMWPYIWQIGFRSAWAISFYVIATGTLFAAGWWQRLVGNPLLLACGAVSYNWYLYHQAIARGLLAARIPPYVTAHAVDDPHWQIVFTLLAFPVTFAAAAIATYGIERPLLALDPAGLRKRYTVPAK